MEGDRVKVEPGSVVQLKSGGPKMTVALKSGENYTHNGVARVVRPDFVLCQWFRDEELFSDQLPVKSLAPVPAADDPKPKATSDRGPG